MVGKEKHRKEWSVSVRKPAGKNTFEDSDLDGRDIYK